MKSMFFDEMIKRIDSYSETEKLELFEEMKRRANDEDEPLPRFFDEIFAMLEMGYNVDKNPAHQTRSKIVDFFFAGDMLLSEIHEFLLDLMIDIEIKHGVHVKKEKTSKPKRIPTKK